MNYFTHLTDEDSKQEDSIKKKKLGGEVCIRGKSVSIGYYKNEKETKDAYDADGWFHTGDIGRWNASGTLSIVDRKKNIFKLSQGEYVAPEKLEVAYGGSRYVSQMCIYGDSSTPFVIAIVRPDADFAKNWATANKIHPVELESLVKNEKFKAAVLEDFNGICKTQKLAGFEAVKDVILTEIEWNAQNELTTPTSKIKRPQLREYYMEKIRECYKANGIELPGGKEPKKEDKKKKKTKKEEATPKKEESTPKKEERKKDKKEKTEEPKKEAVKKEEPKEPKKETKKEEEKSDKKKKKETVTEEKKEEKKDESPSEDGQKKEKRHKKKEGAEGEKKEDTPKKAEESGEKKKKKKKEKVEE
jgi:hypothetical protein